jgi:hypothetical protein
MDIAEVNMPIGMEFSIQDHFTRACFFLDNAIRKKKEENWREFGWCIATSIYSFQAIYEISYSHVNDESNHIGCWHRLVDEYTNIRHYGVVGSYRVQDFHRSAISFYPHIQSFHGPVTVKTSKQKGSKAQVVIGNGKKTVTEEKMQKLHLVGQ